MLEEAFGTDGVSSLSLRWLAHHPPQLLWDGKAHAGLPLTGPVLWATATHLTSTALSPPDDTFLTFPKNYFSLTLRPQSLHWEDSSPWWTISPSACPGCWCDADCLSNQSITSSQPLWLARVWACDSRDDPGSFTAKTKDSGTPSPPVGLLSRQDASLAPRGSVR